MAEGEQLCHPIRAECRSAVGGPGAEIVPDDDGLTGPKGVDQGKRIVRQRLLVGVTVRDLGGVVPAHEWADRAISLGGDAAAKVVPGVRGVRESMQHQHEWP